MLTKRSPQSANNLEGLLTVDDVAKRLKIERKTVYELMARRQISFFKWGRNIRFSVAQVEEFLAAVKVGTSRDKG